MLNYFKKIVQYIIYAYAIIITVVFFMKEFKKPMIKYYDYKDVSTSIDERMRLHLILLNENKVFILEDSVSYGINAQLSTLMMNNIKGWVNK